MKWSPKASYNPSQQGLGITSIISMPPSLRGLGVIITNLQPVTLFP